MVFRIEGLTGTMFAASGSVAGRYGKMSQARKILETAIAVSLAAAAMAVAPVYVSGQEIGPDSGIAEWVRLTPDLRIGNDGELELTSVRFLLPGEDGSLRFFDAEELIVLQPSGRIQSRSRVAPASGERGPASSLYPSNSRGGWDPIRFGWKMRPYVASPC